MPDTSSLARGPNRVLRQPAKIFKRLLACQWAERLTSLMKVPLGQNFIERKLHRAYLATYFERVACPAKFGAQTLAGVLVDRHHWAVAVDYVALKAHPGDVLSANHKRL
jgi:hypothetical protein